MKKKIFAVLTAVLLLCACLPLGATSVLAQNVWDDLFYYEIIDGEVHITACEEVAGPVTIPSTIEGYPVTTIEENAFYAAGIEMTSLIIPSSVTTIEKAAFNSCVNLTSITIGSGVTTIGESAFYNCGSLTSVNLSDGVTVIGDYAFYGCGSLQEITIGKGVTTIGEGAFYLCENLADVYYRGAKAQWDTISLGTTLGLNGVAIHFDDGSTSHYNVTTTTQPTTTTTTTTTTTSTSTTQPTAPPSREEADPTEVTEAVTTAPASADKTEDKASKGKLSDTVWLWLLIDVVAVLIVMMLFLIWHNHRKEKLSDQPKK